MEVRLELSGMACVVSDTAGLRSGSEDVVELEGMRRARAELSRAHIKVFVADSSDALSLQVTAYKLPMRVQVVMDCRGQRTCWTTSCLCL